MSSSRKRQVGTGIRHLTTTVLFIVTIVLTLHLLKVL